MKTRFLILLLALIPSFIYSQEDLGEDEKNFHYIEAGVGAGLSDARHDDTALSIAMTNSLGRYFINFLEYNLYFKKSGVSAHEISFKMGPYYQINRYSYMSIATGVSLFMNAKDDNWNYMGGTYYYEDDYHLNIPVQAKINVGIYKGLCLGFKGTYNKMLDKNTSDRVTAMMFLSYGW